MDKRKTEKCQIFGTKGRGDVTQRMLGECHVGRGWKSRFGKKVVTNDLNEGIFFRIMGKNDSVIS